MNFFISYAVDPSDFSVMSLFLRAGLVVQIVMVILILASIWAWTMIFQKYSQYRKARGNLRFFIGEFWQARSLAKFYQEVGSQSSIEIESIFIAAMNEWEQSETEAGVVRGVMERIERAMQISLRQSRDEWDKGLGVLATIGSTAPFIGLFGTVWGIKTAFQEIALAGSTSLTVVAPGIAEALVATAMGLLAAIPAVIFYNRLTAMAEQLEHDHENFAEEFALILDRQIQSGGM